jgi:hypothetical protein
MDYIKYQRAIVQEFRTIRCRRFVAGHVHVCTVQE